MPLYIQSIHLLWIIETLSNRIQSNWMGFRYIAKAFDAFFPIKLHSHLISILLGIKSWQSKLCTLQCIMCGWWAHNAYPCSDSHRTAPHHISHQLENHLLSSECNLYNNLITCTFLRQTTEGHIMCYKWECSTVICVKHSTVHWYTSSHLFASTQMTHST